VTLAEIHGKLSSTASNASDVREDLLTSDIFGPARYLPADVFLVPFLREATDSDGMNLTATLTRPKVQLWPKLPCPSGGYIEPDVLITADDGEIVMVEAKYFSGLSGENQLEAEFQALDREGKRRGVGLAKRSLIYLTSDWVRPNAEIAAALGDLQEVERSRVFWLNWTAADRVAREALLRPVSQEQRLVLCDIRRLLKKKSLAAFAQLPEPEEFGVPFSFDALALHWPEFDLSPADIYQLKGGES